MSSSSHAEAFIIIERGEDGRPIRIIPYDSIRYICIAGCATLVTEYTKTQIVQDFFNGLGRDIDPTLPKDAKPSEKFFEDLYVLFCLLITDPTLENVNTQGYTWRRPTKAKRFGMLELAIVLNTKVSKR